MPQWGVGWRPQYRDWIHQPEFLPLRSPPSAVADTALPRLGVDQSWLGKGLTPLSGVLNSAHCCRPGGWWAPSTRLQPCSLPRLQPQFPVSIPSTAGPGTSPGTTTAPRAGIQHLAAHLPLSLPQRLWLVLSVPSCWQGLHSKCAYAQEPPRGWPFWLCTPHRWLWSRPFRGERLPSPGPIWS